MEFTEDVFKRRIAALLPAKSAGRGSNGNGHNGQPAAKHDPADLSSLWPIVDDEQFLQEAYRQILGRECDISGFVNYLELLRRHVPRRSIVLQLVNSDEAKGRGVRFTGIPGPVSVAGRQTPFPPLRRFVGRILGQARELLRRPLYARFDSIDHKLNYLLRDVSAKTDNLSTKTDQALWTISKKLDTYVADLQEYQIQIRDLLGKETAANTEALARATAGAAQSLSALSRKLDGYVLDLQSQFAAGQSQLQQAQHEHQRRIIVIETELAKLRATAENVSHRARSAVVRGGNNVIATEVDGFILGMPGEEWRMAAYHAFRGMLEPGLTRCFQSLVKPGMTVVDVGANIGVYTLYAARLLQGRGKIHSFEPTPRTYEILRDNIQVNGFLESGVIELHQTAVTDRSGTSPFAVFSNDSGHNTLFADGPGKLEVQTISLDEALPAETVDLVKIDAEGAEPLILRGMRQIIERSPAIRIIIEFAPVNLRQAGVDPESFLREIDSLGFHVRRIHDETGELVEPRDLPSVFSTNLLLTRGGPA